MGGGSRETVSSGTKLATTSGISSGKSTSAGQPPDPGACTAGSSSTSPRICFSSAVALIAIPKVMSSLHNEFPVFLDRPRILRDDRRHVADDRDPDRLPDRADHASLLGGAGQAACRPAEAKRASPDLSGGPAPGSRPAVRKIRLRSRSRTAAMFSRRARFPSPRSAPLSDFVVDDKSSRPADHGWKDVAPQEPEPWQGVPMEDDYQ